MTERREMSFSEISASLCARGVPCTAGEVKSAFTSGMAKLKRIPSFRYQASVFLDELETARKDRYANSSDSR